MLIRHTNFNQSAFNSSEIVDQATSRFSFTLTDIARRAIDSLPSSNNFTWRWTAIVLLGLVFQASNVLGVTEGGCVFFPEDEGNGRNPFDYVGW